MENTRIESWKPYVKELLSRGVTVIPLLDMGDLTSLRKGLYAAVASFPEFKDGLASAERGKLILDPFAALSHASAYHNPQFARRLRIRAMHSAVPFFKSFVQRAFPREQRESYHMEQLMDRMMWRPPNTIVAEEQWHRDLSPNAQPGDVIFGGWINASAPGTEPHYFTCVPGTHYAPTSEPIKHSKKNLKQGFAALSERDKTTHAVEEKTEKIACPPGHWILFFQSIVHSVVGTARRDAQQRLFVGWRLTQTDEPLYPETETWLIEQGVPVTPSGEVPQMFPYDASVKKVHKWIDAEFSDNFIAFMKRKYPAEYEDYGVTTPMPSLDEMKMMYEPYSKYEMAMFRPRRKWKLPSTNGEYVRMTWERDEEDTVAEEPKKPVASESEEDVVQQPREEEHHRRRAAVRDEDDDNIVPHENVADDDDDEPIIRKRHASRHRILEDDDDDENAEEKKEEADVSTTRVSEHTFVPPVASEMATAPEQTRQQKRDMYDLDNLLAQDIQHLQAQVEWQNPTEQSYATLLIQQAQGLANKRMQHYKQTYTFYMPMSITALAAEDWPWQVLHALAEWKRAKRVLHAAEKTNETHQQGSSVRFKTAWRNKVLADTGVNVIN